MKYFLALGLVALYSATQLWSASTGRTATFINKTPHLIKFSAGETDKISVKPGERFVYKQDWTDKIGVTIVGIAHRPDDSIAGVYIKVLGGLDHDASTPPQYAEYIIEEKDLRR